MGGPRACVWLAHRRRGHLPSLRSEWWGCASTSFSVLLSQKDVHTYVPNATSPKRARGRQRASRHSYSPECGEGKFSDLRRTEFYEVRIARADRLRNTR